VTLTNALILFIITASAQAAENQVRATAPTPKSVVRPGLQLVFEPSTALKSASDPSYSAGADFHIIPSLTLSPAWKLATYWTLQQEWSGERTTKLTRSEVRGTWAGAELARGLSWGAFGSVVLPLTYRARTDESLVFGARVAPRLTYDLGAVSRVPLLLEYEPTLRRNFHEYTTSALGAPNAQFSVTQRGLLGVDLGRGWGLNSQLAYYSFWSYEGDLWNKFKWDQEVTFSPDPKWSFALGISNFANGMRANGLDSNLGIFDYETTVMYGTFGFSI
jgi:hypothetical protein